MPGDGAAVGRPLLSKLIVIDVPKLAFNVADVCTMLSDAEVVAIEVAKLYAGLLAVITADPGFTPMSVALTVNPPALMCSGEDCTATFAGLSDTTSMSTPPAGAGAAICTGICAVCPYGTLIDPGNAMARLCT